MNTSTRQSHRRRNVLIAAGLSASLILGGGAWAANRYLIAHVSIDDVSSYESEHSSVSGEGVTTTTDGTVSGTTYSSDEADISISTVTTGEGDDTITYYVADVTLSDATALRSAFAGDAFGTNITETTSEIAEENNAIFAINGDYYGFRDTGIVIRNGVVYRDEGAREGLAFYLDGHVEVYDETTRTADSLVADGVWSTLSFGPALVENGGVVDGIDEVEVDTNIGNHSIQGEQPRTVVGVIDDNYLVFVVVDGRSPGYSRGMTMTELADLMVSLGATTAYNLDGGGSSTMYFDGDLVNDPLGKDQERGTSDILYIAGSSS